MMRRVSLIDRQPAAAGWWVLLITGVLLIALATLVIYQPAVLIHLAAAMLAMAGVVCLVLAWRVRQFGRVKAYRYWSEWWWADVV